MILYLDSSALAKQYLQETGSAGVKSLVESASGVVTSIVAYPEMRAALARALRANRLDEAGYDSVLSAFESDWATTTQLDVHRPLTADAGELAARYHLRGFDALHLASATDFQRSFGEPVTFLAFDARLMTAASAEGLATPDL